MPRGKPARKRPAASASAERPPAQSKRRNTATTTPVLAVEDNINAVSNSGSVTNVSTDAVCTPSVDSSYGDGPGSSIQGNTAGDDSACLDKGGTCQDDSLSCSGDYVSGLCSGSSSRRCCIEYSACLARDGTCQDDSLSCPGEYLSGLCSGASNRRCCIGADSGMCSNVKVYSRATWGARGPTSVSNISTPVDLFFIHHTTGSSCYDFSSCAAKVRNTQNYHMDTKGWSDIGYSFLVGEDGAVYEGRGWKNEGAHTSGYNSQSFAAAVIGDFMTTKPNNASLNAVKNLTQCGVNLGHINSTYSLYGHRDVSTSSCPGDALYNEIKTWLHYNTTTP